jgi:HEAT repeat protein
MAYTASPEAVDVLEGLVFADESKSIQLEALDSLRKMNENRGLPSLMRIAEFHPDAELRNEAIQWMGRSGSATVVSLLKQIALEDLDKDNRKEAIDALGTLVDESAF